MKVEAAVLGSPFLTVLMVCGRKATLNNEVLLIEALHFVLIFPFHSFSFDSCSAVSERTRVLLSEARAALTKATQEPGKEVKTKINQILCA